MANVGDGGLVGHNNLRSALGVLFRGDALLVVMQQSTPSKIKNLGMEIRCCVHVGDQGAWIADRTIRRRGIQQNSTGG